MGIMDTEKIYEGLGISREVWEYGQRTESRLKERFEEFDKNAEYNQMKVIRAMQENRVSEGCFNYVSGYGLPICVRAMNCSLRSESRMIHWKK